MIKTDVVIIGGGATGCGIARDLAMRGIPHCLLEKGDLAAGATGACHGLLHSGGRYAVRDIEVAGECIRENRTLTRIGDKCVEDTGGLFVMLPGDTEEYYDRFLECCEKAGIDAQPISAVQALEIEPRLNPALLRAVKVPDRAIDPFRLCMLNTESSVSRGFPILIHHEVIEILQDRGNCTGVRARNTFTGEEVEVSGKLIINATGAWGDRVAEMAGAQVALNLSKGSLVIASHRLTNTVINRLRPPSDGDIIVPNESVCLAGTTSIHVEDPDNLSIESGEVAVIREEAGSMLPDFATTRLIRTYTGVRPLLKDEGADGDDRSVNRGFRIIDHGNRLYSVLGGKLTTYRLMAERMVDKVMEIFGLNIPCTTAETPLEGQDKLSGYPLSKRLESMEDLVCECELVRREDVERIIEETGTGDIGDIQHRTRLGMGPCQGGYCTYRSLGLMQRMGRTGSSEPVEILRRFLQRRFKGIRPVLWGDQLREEQLVEAIYLSTLGMRK